MPTIVYQSNDCPQCESHTTDLGTLKQLLESVTANFPQLNEDMRFNLFLEWFRQSKLDERMLYIEKSKNKTTEKIQAYKKSNIQSFKKEE